MDHQAVPAAHEWYRIYGHERLRYDTIGPLKCFGGRGDPVTDSSPDGRTERSNARRTRRDAWLIAVVAALIGAAATLIVGLISNSKATIDVITGSSPAPAKVTITPSAAPRATVTVTASPVPTRPGPVTLPGCPASQGCKGYNLVVRPNEGITFATGALVPNTQGDLNYQRSEDGALEITSLNGDSFYSIDVARSQASKQGCQALTNSDVDTHPIMGFHKGLAFCVAIRVTPGGGLALVEQTRPLGSGGTLYLTEEFWPNDNS
jgi:hypothetical protein